MLGFTAFASGETLVLEGVYQKQNIYVNNCSGSDGVGFSVSEVRVNGELSADQVESSAFEISLDQLSLVEGQKVVIQIIYSGECTPKVLNPGALQPVPTFEINKIDVDESGLLTWEATNERGSLPYSIEQFKWNKWVKVGEVDGIGTPEAHNYSFQTNMVSGLNKFRVVQKNLSGVKKTGKSATTSSTKTQPTFEYDKKNQKVVFSDKTSYEVFDMYGQIRKRGMSNEIDFSNLESGDYYLNFDNAMQRVKKK